MARSVDQLRIRNLDARVPLVRHREGTPWEPRVESASNSYRFLSAFSPRRLIVILQGFQEKTQTLPRREIATAFGRWERFLDQEERR